MGGAASRTKGHNFERWVAQQLRPIFPKARRGLQYQDGTGAPDVINTPFHIEAKKGKATNIKAAIAQALADANTRAPHISPSLPPELAEPLPVVAITRDDHEEALVTMRFEDWIKLVEAVYGRRELAEEKAA